MRKMPKHHAQNRDFMPKRHAQNAEMLIYYIMLKGRNVHTCSNLELYNVVINRSHDNRWTTDNFRSIVLYA